MAVTKINADGWSFEVNAVAIKGIEDFDISRAITRADTIDFESEGSEEHRVIRRGKVLTLNGHYLEDEANGDRDPGQQAITDLAEEVGSAAEGSFKLISPGGNEYAFTATVEEGTSGDKNDVTKFSYNLTRTGGTVFTSAT